MKLLKRPIQIELDIVLDIRERLSSQSVAATFQVEHKSGISKKYIVSDKVRDRYGAIVESAIETISTFPKLHIGKVYQSNESYTVYIPVHSDAIQELLVKFRLHDHARDTLIPNIPDSTSTKTVIYIKDIRMNGQAVDNEIEMLMILKEICQGLCEGDIHPLIDLAYDE